MGVKDKKRKVMIQFEQNKKGSLSNGVGEKF